MHIVPEEDGEVALGAGTDRTDVARKYGKASLGQDQDQIQEVRASEDEVRSNFSHNSQPYSQSMDGRYENCKHLGIA